MKNLNKKNSTKFILLLCLTIIVILIYSVIRIYALFYSELNGKVHLENGVWNIIINGTDITKEADVEFVIDNIDIGKNEHVKPGNLAPGLTGNFKININPQDTDVSIRYDIILDEEKLTNDNIQIKSIKETQEENELIRVDKNTYAGIITLDRIKSGNKNEIAVEIEWVDDEENNEPDILIGTTWGTNFEIPITVHVCQYLGEKIEPYIENVE